MGKFELEFLPSKRSIIGIFFHPPLPLRERSQR
jgi:hypothetical protein